MYLKLNTLLSVHDGCGGVGCRSCSGTGAYQQTSAAGNLGDIRSNIAHCSANAARAPSDNVWNPNVMEQVYKSGPLHHYAISVETRAESAIHAGFTAFTTACCVIWMLLPPTANPEQRYRHGISNPLNTPNLLNKMPCRMCNTSGNLTLTRPAGILCSI